MIRFIESRGTGKTYRLLHIANKHKGLVVCNNTHTMEKWAEFLGLKDIAGFISYENFLEHIGFKGTTIPIYIDEMEMFIKHLNSNIEGYNLSIEGALNWWEA